MNNVILIDRSDCIITYMEVNNTHISTDNVISSTLRLTGTNLSEYHKLLFQKARHGEHSFLILSPFCVASFTGTIRKVSENFENYYFVGVNAHDLKLNMHPHALRDYKLGKLLE